VVLSAKSAIINPRTPKGRGLRINNLNC